MEGTGKKRGRSASRSSGARRSMSISRSRSRPAAADVGRRTAPALGVEKKFFDTALAAVTLTASATCAGGEVDPTALPAAVLCLSCPSQNSTSQGREGRKIKMKSIQVKGRINGALVEDGSDPAPSQKVFVALVLDRQTNSAQLNSEDVFSNLNAEVSGCTFPMRNMNFAERFKVLRSDVFDLDRITLAVDATDSHASQGRALQFEWFVPLDLNVAFNTTTPTASTVASVVDNSLHMIAFCSATANAPSLQYNARLRFLG